MKGGIIAIVGFILLVSVLALMYAVITCTTPGSQGSAFCAALNPVLSVLESLIGM